MRRHTQHAALGMIFALLCGQQSSAQATELVYTPVNPNFGGNPLNGTYLLNQAQLQNDHDDPDALSSSFERPSDLDRFVSSLQSRLIGQLLADVGDGNTGSLTTDQFSIAVNDDGAGGLEVLVTDLITGDTTTISVNGLIPD